MSVHSNIGASSMSRWSVCPASVRLSEGLPNISSPEAEEGTYAHEVAEQILNNKLIDCEDPEVIDNVMVYVEYCRSLQIGCSTYGVEEKFDLSSIFEGLFGTCDYWAFSSNESTLRVVDYKHGRGIAVEVLNNKQLRYYALGALLKLKLPVKFVEMTIVQPRCWHPDGAIRSWKIPVSDLLDFTADLIDAAELTKDPNAPIVPGDHCRFCLAAPTCKALHELAVVTAQEEFSPTINYTPEKLAEVLNKIPAIEAWCKSVEQFAFFEAQKGREIPGYKLVPKKTHRKWKEIENLETQLLLEAGLSYDEVWNKKMKTPAQVEALLDKEGKKLLEQFIFKPDGGNTLAKITDRRSKAKSQIETEFTVINATKE